MIEEDFFWGTYVQGVAIGDTSPENSYGWATVEAHDTEVDNAFYSIIDTGSTAIMISALYFEDYLTKIMEKVPDVNWTLANN